MFTFRSFALLTAFLLPFLLFAGPAYVNRNQEIGLWNPTVVPQRVKVLCEGKNFSDWGRASPIEVGDSQDDRDPNIQKIIKNCTFVNPPGVAVFEPAIVIKQGKNILIEGSRFENIRTLEPGIGIFAIGLPAKGPISDVTLLNNIFKYIGADGLQPGTSGPDIRNLRIENNEFIGSEEVGENGVDVKGVFGPIYIVGNRMHGFRPCESPKTNPPGRQDCTGSFGAAITIHQGSNGLTPTDVFISGNELFDNTKGIHVSDGKNVTVEKNIIHNNLTVGIEYSGGDVNLSENTYYTNPKNCTKTISCQ